MDWSMQGFLSSKLIFMSKISCSEKNPTTKSYHVNYMIIVLHWDWMQMWQLRDSTADPMRRFLRKKACLGYCFSETNIFILCTSFSCCQVKKTLRRFQLEAPRAYKCKQILCLQQGSIDLSCWNFCCCCIWNCMWACDCCGIISIITICPESPLLVPPFSKEVAMQLMDFKTDPWSLFEELLFLQTCWRQILSADGNWCKLMRYGCSCISGSSCFGRCGWQDILDNTRLNRLGRNGHKTLHTQC